MAVLVAATLAMTGLAADSVYAEKPTYVDSATFTQYLDEDEALDAMRSGNLDMYYSNISPKRLATAQSQENLITYDAPGGTYSILVNPAVSDDKFNPFQDRDVRFALNYLVNRDMFVNDILSGYGVPLLSYYGPSSPDYPNVMGDLAAFGFGYDASLAERTISERLSYMGAVKTGDNSWEKDGEPVAVTIFIRHDDPARNMFGGAFASELESLGFSVERIYGDLGEAFDLVYGSDPADMKWHIYTEGHVAPDWSDSSGLANMYAPWGAQMPGLNNPAYWNYENERLDTLTRQIYTSDFTSEEQRTELIRDAIVEGVSESVRIFLVTEIDKYATHESVSGVVNDFSAGLPNRFTPINAQIAQDHNDLRIGIKHIYQGSWNPVMGFQDAYSLDMWNLMTDPITVSNPHTGSVMPVRAVWDVTTSGPDAALDVADDAIIWDTASQEWVAVAQDATATSKVTFQYRLGSWHNGSPIDMLDVLYSFYFAKEWGGPATGPDDATFDTEYTSMTTPNVQTIKGIKPLDNDTIEVYVDYWHFDENEIAKWAAPDIDTPWDVLAAMEQLAKNDRVSFSKSGAASKGVDWISLVLPDDAALVRQQLSSMKDAGHVPSATTPPPDAVITGIIAGLSGDYHADRYESSITWIDQKGHALISNGPFYLDGYMPESNSVRLVSFDDDAYPFEQGRWSQFVQIVEAEPVAQRSCK